MMAQTVFCVCNPIESVAVCLKLNDTSQIVITYKTVLFDFCCHLFSANIKKKKDFWHKNDISFLGFSSLALSGIF